MQKYQCTKNENLQFPYSICLPVQSYKASQDNKIISGIIKLLRRLDGHGHFKAIFLPPNIEEFGQFKDLYEIIINNQAKSEYF